MKEAEKTGQNIAPMAYLKVTGREFRREIKGYEVEREYTRTSEDI